ncbi:MAG: hypothetical protein AB1716_01515 [Planctomycetota bacterium]
MPAQARNRPPTHAASASAGRGVQALRIPLFVLAGGSAALLLALGGPDAWLVLADDGLRVALVLAAATGWGLWPAGWLRRRASPGNCGLDGRLFCLACALGLGALSLATLGLGATGLLTAATAWVLVLVGILAGVGRLALFLHSRQIEPATPPPGRADKTSAGAATGWTLGRAASVGTTCLLLLTLAPPLAVALFGASLPPGVLWDEENRGYDVLEYHLQAPREYYDAGRIHFLPHNVYAAFPQQMEMLYLLLMYLRGGPLAGAIPAQFLHAACGVLAALAIAAWSRPGWPRRIALVTAGSVPWMAYLGALAYVELGVLFFTSVAAGLLLEGLNASDASGGRNATAETKSPCENQRRAPYGKALPCRLRKAEPCDTAPHDLARPFSPGCLRLFMAAGLCAGLAAGCKYPAVAFVPVALAVALLLAVRGALARRIGNAAVFGIMALAAFSPWLIRNAAFTGNPVYPFAYSWFGGAGWSAEQDAQWARGHALPPERGALPQRVAAALDETVLSPMFGPALWIIALGALLLARSRETALLGVWAVLILLAWAALTHMPGRFAVPVLVPLALAAGRLELPSPSLPHRALTRMGAALMTGGFVLIAGLGAVVNDATLLAKLAEHSAWWRQARNPLPTLAGRTADFAELPLLEGLPADARVWLVGDARAFYLPANVHYTVVFNRDPWLAHAARSTPTEAVAWLRTQGVTHVVFCWDEIERLRRTYGFPEFVTPAWAETLVAAGLRRVPADDTGPGRVETFEVTAP